MAKFLRYFAAVVCGLASAYLLLMAYVLLQFARYSDRWSQFPGLNYAIPIALLAVLLLAAAWNLVRWGQRRILPHFRLPRQFSLRTILVLMTLLAVGLGYVVDQWRIVRERGELLGLLRHEFQWQGGLIIAGSSYHYIPWTWRFLGERPNDWRYPLPVDSELRARVLAAFPEAEIGMIGAQGRWERVDRSSLK